MYFKNPKEKKFKKYHKLNIKNSKKNKFVKLYSNNFNNNKELNLRVYKGGYISINELNAVTLFLRKKLNKKNFYFKIFPDFFLTKKPSETRMGKGKGNISTRICYIKKNQIILKINNLKNLNTNLLLNSINEKLNIKIYQESSIF